jgi:hypothetical protein
MKLNGLIKVRRDTPLLESAAKADSKVVERRKSIRMIGG